MNLPAFEAIFQGTSLLVLAITVYVAYRQLRAATDQARASEAQAKSSEQMAQLSLQQTELMRKQLHASFRPVIEAVGGNHTRDSAALLTLKNVGAGPAFAIRGKYRSGAPQNVLSLAPQESTEFRFDYNLNLIQKPIGPPGTPWKEPTQSVPLRLEYQSVTGAMCWTNIDFHLRGEGPVEPKNEHGVSEV